MAKEAFDKIVWEEPPPKRTRAGKSAQSRWVKRLEPFKDRPGQWARIGAPAKYTTLSSRQRTLKMGQAEGVNPEDWEFEIRSPETDGETNYYLYVRYVGQPASIDENIGDPADLSEADFAEV